MSQKDMKILGIDIFVEAPLSTEFPCLVAGMRNSLCTSRGAPINAETAKEVLDIGWVCVRYVFEAAAEESAETNAQIAEVTKIIGEQFRWSSIIKLYEIDGQPMFS